MSEAPWHGYAKCPECGSDDIVEAVDERDVMLVVFCGGCGQTLCDFYVGDEDD